MDTQFRNVDAPGQAQTVTITFTRCQALEDYPDVSWLTDEDRYADCEDAEEAAKCKAADQARMEAFIAGDWSMCGLFVKASIMVPIGGCSFTMFELQSSGLWGVEDDSDHDYMVTIWEEQEAELKEAMRVMGKAFIGV